MNSSRPCFKKNSCSFYQKIGQKKSSAPIQTAHPYLETIDEKTRLSAFLRLRSDRRAILIDKVDSAYGIKVSSEIDMQMPILAGASIKAMLSQLSDEGIDEILARTEIKRYTPYFIIDKAVYKEEILEVRTQALFLLTGAL